MPAAARLALAACLTLTTPLAASRAISALVERDVYLMGTRASLAVAAPTRAAGLADLAAAVAILEDTERELSTWKPDSALSQLNRAAPGTLLPLRAAACRMFGSVYEWHAASAGAFDPAIGALIEAWRIHDGGRVPDEETLAAARTRSGLRLLAFDPRACTMTRRADVTIDAGAFGKGEALDRVAAALDGDWLIDLGGQVAAEGTAPGGAPWTVDLAHPHQRELPALRVALPGGSLATSGGSERDTRVGGVRVGHVLDPRTGRPATFEGSVTVWHERALVADMLSTALYVMGPDEGASWADAHGVRALFLLPDGEQVRVVPSRAWRDLTPDSVARQPQH